MSTHDYSSLSYWDKRYTEEHLEVFEWYQTYDTLKEKIIEYIKPEDKILNIGCGTSKLAEDLYIDEIKDVTNIDFSDNAIKIMEERYHEQGIEMKYKRMDATEMTEFTDKSFNVVFDKALLDSVLCGENALGIADKMIKEVHRVLTDNGYYIIISNSSEETRKSLFDDKLWEYKVLEIEKPLKVVLLDEKDKDPKNYHYIYILKKKYLGPNKEEIKEEEKKEEKKEEVKNVKKK